MKSYYQLPITNKTAYINYTVNNQNNKFTRLPRIKKAPCRRNDVGGFS